MFNRYVVKSSTNDYRMKTQYQGQGKSEFAGFTTWSKCHQLDLALQFVAKRTSGINLRVLLEYLENQSAYHRHSLNDVN